MPSQIPFQPTQALTFPVPEIQFLLPRLSLASFTLAVLSSQPKTLESELGMGADVSHSCSYKNYGIKPMMGPERSTKQHMEQMRAGAGRKLCGPMHMLSSGFCCGFSHFAPRFLMLSSCHSHSAHLRKMQPFFPSDQIPYIPPLCPLCGDFSRSVCACHRHAY